jgi:hypothetical protein
VIQCHRLLTVFDEMDDHLIFMAVAIALRDDDPIPMGKLGIISVISSVLDIFVCYSILSNSLSTNSCLVKIMRTRKNQSLLHQMLDRLLLHRISNPTDLLHHIGPPIDIEESSQPVIRS